ncbi:MAG TPA: hypothetical protein VFQ25_03900 [Ktedonobacterales bacterium]|nr:hypothetical protein [Ktedonobacterales bacterium]
MSDMTDAEFAQAFLNGALPPARFHHRDHLRLAWYLIRERGLDEATRSIAAGIQRFAAQHGHPEKYHETLTRFWVRVTGHHVKARPDIADFDAFLAAFPPLLDTSLPYQHWRRETMMSQAARARWVEPDLCGLPA